MYEPDIPRAHRVLDLDEDRPTEGRLKIVVHPEPGGRGWRVEIERGPVLYRELALSVAQNKAQHELIWRGGGEYVLRGETGMVLSLMTIDTRVRERLL